MRYWAWCMCCVVMIGGSVRAGDGEEEVRRCAELVARVESGHDEAAAAEKLGAAGIDAVGVVERALAKWPEEKDEKRVVEVRATRRVLERVARSLYARHAEGLFDERWPRLVRDLHDERANWFMAGVGLEDVWPKVQTLKREEQLKFLLARVRGRPYEQATQEKLRAYSAKEVLEMAAATWWPVEIEPLERDGTYGWTTRAGKVEGNTATDVIRFGVWMEGWAPESEKGQWRFCEAWGKWTWVVRFTRRHAQMDAWVVTEPQGWTLSSEFPWERRIGCKSVRGWPAGVKVPVVEMPARASISLGGGASMSEWARAYVPKEYVGQIKFVANRYGAPVVKEENDGDGEEKYRRWAELIEKVKADWQGPAAAELAGGDVEAVGILEREIAKIAQAQRVVDEKRVATLIEDVLSESEEVQKAAERELELMGPKVAPLLLEAFHQKEADKRPRATRVQMVYYYTGVQARRGALQKALMTLYKRHVDVLFEERWGRLGRDLYDEKARWFVSGVDLETVWPKLEKLGRAEQLRFLLARRRGYWNEEVEKKLDMFSVKEMLAAAAATYWPVELERGDGWARRAGKLEGNVATDVFYLEWPKGTREAEARRGQWTYSMTVHERMAYVFRWAKPFIDWNGVAVGEARTAHDWMGIDEMEVSSWRVREVPAAMRLPVVEFTTAKDWFWHQGRLYEWARAYVPEEWRGRVKFAANEAAVPVVKEAGTGTTNDQR